MHSQSGSHRMALLDPCKCHRIDEENELVSVSELQSCEKWGFLWRSHVISGKNICKDGRVSKFFWRGF